MPLEAQDTNAPELVWFPVIDIIRFKAAHTTMPNFPLDEASAADRALRIRLQEDWHRCVSRAEDIVVVGLPWSDIATTAVAWRMFKSLRKRSTHQSKD